MKLGNILGRAGLAAAVLVMAACLDPIAPPVDNPIEIKLDFCSNEVPVWFAHQNGDGPFTVITPDAAGTYTFNASNREAIAFVRQNGSDYRTEIIYTSNVVLEGLSGLACVEEVGVKQVNGSVSGLSGAQLGLVGMSFSSVFLTAAQTSFTLTQLVDRPLDLIASRVDVNGDEQLANKTVIRRSQTPTSGSTMAPINFDSDGFAPVLNSAVVGGVQLNENAFLMNNFFSQLETSHTLSFVDKISDGSVPFVSIPAAELAAGDYHDLFVVATTLSGGVRGSELYFRNPANQSFSLGGVLAEPFVSVVGSTPHVRLRVQVAGQFEYSTMVTSDFHQQTSFSSVDVSMSVTASYFGGTPFEWNLPMPNFDGLPGWQNSWALKTGNIDWTITAYFGRPTLIFGAKPADQDAVQFASRSSSMAAALANRMMHPVPSRRHFSRLR